MKLAVLVATRHLDVNAANSVALQVIDYWLESEVIHSGINAIDYYEIEDAQDLNTEVVTRGIDTLKDLYAVKEWLWFP